MNKRHAQKIHAKRRAIERYQVNINRDEYNQMIGQIQNGKAIFVERQSLRLSVWVVSVNGKKLIAVYDSVRKTIATFLTPQMAANNIGRMPPAFAEVASA